LQASAKGKNSMSKPTKKNAGITKLGPRRYKIRVTARHPLTGKRHARQTIISNATLERARQMRQQLLEELRVELAAPPAPVVKSTTVADYSEQWLVRKARRLRPTTASAYVELLSRHVLPFLGHVELKDLNRGHVEDWVSWAEQRTTLTGRPYSHQTLKTWWRTLCTCLRDAAAEHGIPDPTNRVRPPESQVKRVYEHRALSAQQLKQLLESVKAYFPSWYPEAYICAMSGVRPSELYGITWDDVDYAESQVRLRRSVSRQRRANPPKTGVPRQIPLTRSMVKVLQQHRALLEAEGHPGLEANLVFPNVKGGYRTAPSFLNTLRRAGDAAGLPVKIGPKTLRKTFITLTALSGQDRLTIRSTVGHSSEQMTETYAWVSPEQKQQMVNEFESLVHEAGA
jgi:integrase